MLGAQLKNTLWNHAGGNLKGQTSTCADVFLSLEEAANLVFKHEFLPRD